MSEVKAKSKWVRIAPRKLDRVVKTVRGMMALKAIDTLQFMPQKGARIIEKVIKSAVANAKNNFKLSEASLKIAHAFVTKGIKMKRWQPRARGRIFPIQKRTSHITVVVKSIEEKVKEAA